MQDPILKTKLFCPGLPGRTVARPRLVAQLEEGLRLGHRLSLVSAPAGFGKTSVVVEWLTGAGRAFAWLSLDEGDNDPVRFIAYLLAALQKIDPDLGLNAASLLGGVQRVVLEPLLTILLNDLAAAGRLVVLVLDDYQYIRQPEIHQAVQLLIERAPEIFHLVLITREDPPLPLGRLRVRGQLSELRIADLRFTPEESRQFLGACLSPDLLDPAAEALYSRTEGWAAGLQLASLSLRGHPNPLEFTRAFSGSHHYVIDYLAEEVLRRLSPETRDFLTQTAILELLCADLCDYVLESGSSSAPVLAALEKANLFLIPLDESRTWFRYHRLFGDYLLSLTPEGELASRHARAAEWYAAHGFVAEALRHYLAAGNIAGGRQVIRAAANETIRRGELSSLLNWINQLPDGSVRLDADLSAYKGMVLLLTEQIQEAASFAVSAEACLNEESSAEANSRRGRVTSLKAFLAVSAGNLESALALCQAAAGLLGDGDDALLSFVLAKLGQVQQQVGDVAAAQATFQRGLAVARRSGGGMAKAIVYSNLALMTYLLGRRRDAEEICRQGFEDCRDAQGRLLPIALLIDVAMGLIEYQTNRLDAAEQRLERVMKASAQLGISTLMVGGRNTLALVQFARGNPTAAYAGLDETIRMATQAGVEAIARQAASVRANLDLRLGHLEQAAAWLAACELPLEPVDRQRETEYYPACQVLIRQKRFNEAQALLNQLRSLDEQQGSPAYRIVDWVLQADLNYAAGDSVRAVQALEQAVRLAAGEEYRRPFLDYGGQLAGLLGQVRGVAPLFIDSLLGPQADVLTNPLPASLPAAASSPPAVLEEPLSERELDVLRLLALGLSNRAIAERLVLTEGTARWHANNIYGKLGVHSRTQAVALARNLKLI